MDGKTTVKYLQNYIKQKDYHPELVKDYFMKLSEEVGELSRAIQKGLKAPNSEEIKGTIDNELYQGAQKEVDEAINELEKVELSREQNKVVDKAISTTNASGAVYGATAYKQGV